MGHSLRTIYKSFKCLNLPYYPKLPINNGYISTAFFEIQFKWSLVKIW